MKLLRKRKPSVKSMLGVTKATKRLKKATGVTAAMKPLRAPRNLVHTAKRRTGYESEAAGWFRWLGRRLGR